MKRLCEGINESAETIHANNKEKGFWDNPRNVGELLMLVTSELGEALEAHQKGRHAHWDNYSGFDLKSEFSPECFDPSSFAVNIKDTFEDEIADAVIRLLDLAAGLNIDLELHINAKVEFNKTRERLHGKQY